MKMLILMTSIVLGIGCARVQVQAPKEPIKIDISMRLDIYQHVVKDIDAIEDIVSGRAEKAKPKDNSSLLRGLISVAYAQEGLGPEVEQAALRRRERRSQLHSWEERGVVRENRFGLAEIRSPADADSSLEVLIRAENTDRMIIYEAVAKKNDIAAEEVQGLYSKRLQSDAPQGTPIEVLNESTGKYGWRIKE